MTQNHLNDDYKQKTIIEEIFIDKYHQYKKRRNDLIALDLYYRNLKAKTYSRTSKTAAEYMKEFKQFKNCSKGKAEEMLAKRMKTIVTQRNTTKKK